MVGVIGFLALACPLWMPSLDGTSSPFASWQPAVAIVQHASDGSEPLEGPLFASVEDLVVGWNENVDSWMMSAGVVPHLDEASIVLGPPTAADDDERVFATKPAGGLLMGGVLNASGAVTHLTVEVAALSLYEVVVLQSITVPDLPSEFRFTYSDVAFDDPCVSGYIAGTTRDVSIRCVRTETEPRVVQVTVGPLTDEASAHDEAEWLLEATYRAWSAQDTPDPSPGSSRTPSR